jgi:hypothetical protein
MAEGAALECGRLLSAWFGEALLRLARPPFAQPGSHGESSVAVYMKPPTKFRPANRPERKLLLNDNLPV